MARRLDRPGFITRRNFLYLSGLGIAGVVATACGGGDALPGQTPTSPSPQATTAGAAQTTAAAQPTAATSAAQTQAAQPTAATSAAQTQAAAPKAYKEVPQLAQLVKDGKLPAVAERLPKNPIVITPVERVGKYGGAWRAMIRNPADQVWLSRTVGHEPLVRWDLAWEQVIPGVAESFQISPDGKEFTFKLREGLKWSDGQPATTDDIMFWWEDVTLNKDLSPGGAPLFMKSGDKVGVIEKVDQLTVRAKFPEPNGLFMTNSAQGGISLTPKHYMQQFHKKYNPNVDQLARDNGAENWIRLYQSKGTTIPGTPFDARWNNADLPTQHGWKLTTGFSSNSPRLVFERNPFYFKVDTEGNQLPYIDRVTFDIVEDPQAQVLKAVSGEIDMQDRTIATNQNKAVFTDNAQKGQYRFFETIPSSMNTVAICLNLTHKDPVKRQIMQNKDFRIGLSHAINRQEIIDVVYVGQGEPWQLAPRKETPWFNERLAKQYTEFSVQKANEFLNKAFPQKDGQGFRLGPDGKRISITIEAAGTEPPDALVLVQKYWQQVGVETQVKAEDRALLYTRKDANEHDAVQWGGDGGLKDGIVEMRYYFPYSFESNFAQAWTAWYNPGGNPRTEKEEPPEITRKQMALYDQIKVTPDEGKQVEIMKQILDIAADQFYAIGVSLPANGYGIVKNNFRNVPAKMFSSGGPYLNPAVTNPSQYFFQ